jgi:hypothetical protein
MLLITSYKYVQTYRGHQNKELECGVDLNCWGMFNYKHHSALSIARSVTAYHLQQALPTCSAISMDYSVMVDCFTLPIAIHDTTHWPTEDLHPCISTNFCQKSHHYNNRCRNSLGQIIFSLHVKKKSRLQSSGM